MTSDFFSSRIIGIFKVSTTDLEGALQLEGAGGGVAVAGAGKDELADLGPAADVHVRCVGDVLRGPGHESAHRLRLRSK